jgi:alanine dehydrogenase
MPLLLTEADVRSLIAYPELVTAMQSAVVRFSAREVNQPLRTVLTVGPDKAFFGVMPASIGETGVLGAKIVTFFTRNAERGLPTHLATVLLFDHDTGALLAILDGRFITEARTAAVSALSARLLVHQPGPVRVAILGSGVQARSHFEAMVATIAVKEVRVWSPTRANLERAVADMTAALGVDDGLDVHAVTTAEQAVQGAQVVVLATSATEPVVDDRWIAEGTHVISVGACRPDQREMDPALVARSRLFVDSREGALTESGDVVLGIREGRFDQSHIAGELGEVVSGRSDGRTAADQVTIFKSLGMAVEDVVSARLVFDRALERGLGTRIDI